MVGASTHATSSAYVYTGSNGQWNQQAKLTASDAAANANFGLSVAISGDTAVVGARNGNAAAGVGAGSAYVKRLINAIPL